LEHPAQSIVLPGGSGANWPGIEKNHPSIRDWFDRHFK
jgi:hypothetical protein